MLGFEVDNIQIMWVYQFIYTQDVNTTKNVKIVDEPQMDKIFVGIEDEEYIYLLNQLNIFLDKHCGNAVEKYIYLEDI